MHEIDKLDPATRSAVRDLVHRNLGHKASAGQHKQIPIAQLLMMIVRDIIACRIIESPSPLRGQDPVVLADQSSPPTLADVGVPPDIASLIHHTLWELHLQGILAPDPVPMDPITHDGQHGVLAFRHLQLTPYGVAVLRDATDRIRVYDPDGYMADYVNADPKPDPEMVRYLSEAISVFRGNHLLATVVLLGAASERLVDVLALTLRDALGESRAGADWFRTKCPDRSNISARFDAVERKLLDEYHDDLRAANLLDGFQDIVKLVFQTLRNARNDVAHPKERVFSWNQVSGFLHLFSQYFRYTNAIIAFLRQNPRS